MLKKIFSWMWHGILREASKTAQKQIKNRKGFLPLFRLLFVTNWGAQILTFFLFWFLDVMVFSGGLGREILAESNKWSQVTLGRAHDKGADEYSQDIAILDISLLKRDSFEGDDSTTDFYSRDSFTRRKALEEIVQGLKTSGLASKENDGSYSEFRPTCIGIDIDFSPDPTLRNGQAPEGHQEFIDACESNFKHDHYELHCRYPSQLDPDRLSTIPVFLGVHRMIKAPHRGLWLGKPQYAHMAAGILFMNQTLSAGPRAYNSIPFKTVITQHVYDDAPDFLKSNNACMDHPKGCPLPSLSAAMAQAHSGQDIFKTGGFFRSMITKDFERKELSSSSGDYWGTADCFLLNESSLPSLTSAEILFDAKEFMEFIESPSADASRIWADRLDGKAVLIGDADAGYTSDLLNVSSMNEPVPGVLIHAAAFLTLIEKPRLADLERFSSLMLNLLLAYLSFFIVAALAETGIVDKRKENQLEIQCIILTVLLSVTFVPLMGYFNIVWSGSLACIFGAFLEGLSTIYYRDGEKKKGK